LHAARGLLERQQGDHHHRNGQGGLASESEPQLDDDNARVAWTKLRFVA
jgi:hypothetical protein